MPDGDGKTRTILFLRALGREQAYLVTCRRLLVALASQTANLMQRKVSGKCRPGGKNDLLPALCPVESALQVPTGTDAKRLSAHGWSPSDYSGRRG